jgi:tetratricopeptide (TPR) repeat protein
MDRAIELLRQLVKDFPKVPDYRNDLCETLARAGFPRGPGGADSTSRNKQLLNEALGLANGLASEYPTVPQYAASRAQVHDRLGVLLHQLKQLDDAEKVLRKGVHIQSDLVKQYPDVIAYNFSLALLQASLGRVLTDRDKLKEARTLLEASAERLEALRKRDERLGFVRMFLDHRYHELYQVLTRLGEKELAAEALRKAEALGPGREQDPPPPPRRDR